MIPDVPENAGTAPAISEYGSFFSLYQKQKRYAVLRSPVPETGRAPEDLVSLWIQLPGSFVCIPDSKEKLPPVFSGTFLPPISLRTFPRRKYIYSRRLPALYRQ